jgi:hypothetical protein
MKRRLIATPWIVLGLALVLACSGGGKAPAPRGDEAPATDAERPAATLDIPGQGGTLPEGHPPLGASKGLVWDVPEGWVEEAPSQNMRHAQYRVDGPGGPAECVVYYFGPSQGGDARANAERWAGQFSQPDGGSSLERMKIDTLAGTRVPVQVVEVTGTYEGGMTGSAEPFEPQPNSMLLGGIAEGPDAPWFFKFTGPEKTVRAQRDAFNRLLTSLRTEG